MTLEMRASIAVREQYLKQLRILDSIIRDAPNDYETRGMRLYLIEAIKRETINAS